MWACALWIIADSTKTPARKENIMAKNYVQRGAVFSHTTETAVKSG